MTGHIDPSSALALAAMPEQEPERRDAWEHAAQCPACRALLEEGLEMLGLIDAEKVRPIVGTALKARVRAAVFTPARGRSRWDGAALALVALVSLLFAASDGHLGEPLAISVGLHCLLYETALGMVPVGAMLLLARRGLAELRPLRVGTLAAGFALVGQLLLRMRCPVHDAALHLFLFHFSGIMLAALLGMSSVRWLPRLR